MRYQGPLTAIGVTLVSGLAAILAGRVAGEPHPALSERAFVSNESDGSISVIDTRSDRVVDTIRVGGKARAMRASEDGASVYVAVSYPSRRGGPDEDRIVQIDTLTGRVVRGYPARSETDRFGRPGGMALTRDGAKLYTANGPFNDVSVVDTRRGAVVKTIPVGERPSDVVIPR